MAGLLEATRPGEVSYDTKVDDDNRGLELLEADLAELDNSIYHLVRSNVELAQFLREDPGDADLEQALQENQGVLVKKRLRAKALRKAISDLRTFNPHLAERPSTHHIQSNSSSNYATRNGGGLKSTVGDGSRSSRGGNVGMNGTSDASSSTDMKGGDVSISDGSVESQAVVTNSVAALRIGNGIPDGAGVTNSSSSLPGGAGGGGLGTVDQQTNEFQASVNSSSDAVPVAGIVL